MNITLDDFIKQYNRCIDWNAELRRDLPIGILESQESTREILDDFLSIEKITPDIYDIDETAKLYVANEDTNRYELHIYSNKSNGYVYFWCTIGITESEYKKKRIERVNKEVVKLYDIASQEAKKANDKLTAAKAFNDYMYIFSTRNNVNLY